jgi:hypothetical protein
MHRILSLVLLVLPLGTIFASPELTIEVNGVARTSGSTLRLASQGVSQVTDPIEFPAPEGPITVSFPNVGPGDYVGQISTEGDFWSDVTGLLVHPATGTLSFPHDPGPVVTVFYRLSRFVDACATITLRNTGDMPLTGIAASLTGTDFSLDTAGMATSLSPGETTTLTVCVTATDLNEHLATLQITSSVALFTLGLVGDNDPGPIQSPNSLRLVGVTWDHGGAERLCFVDTASGTATPFSATRIEKILGIAWDNARQTLYGTTTHLSSPAKRLVKIDPLTGATLSQHGIGIEGLAQVAEGDVAVQPSTGLVFCLRSGGGVQVWDPGTETLSYAFQLPTPAAFNDYSTLAFNAAGDLFTIDPNSFTNDPTGIPQLHRIDPLDGTILSTVSLSAPLGVVMGMTFHPETNDAFVADSCDAEPNVGPDICDGFTLYRLNVTTGQLTAVGPTSVGFGLCGLTFMPDFTPASPAPEVRVEGPVGEIASGQPTVFQFDANPFGGGTAHSFTIHNDGNLNPLVLSGVSLPPGFTTSLTGLPRNIEPGQSLVLTISSIGPTQGVYQGNVVLTTNDADEGTFTFPIRALFNLPEISVGSGFFGSNELTNDGPLDVGTTRLGETRSFSLRVRNLHAGPLTVSGITLPPGYTLAAPVPTFPFSLAKDQTRDINFTIISTTAGTFSGTLAIQNNDFDEGPFNLQLTGTVSPESILFFGFSTSINEGGSLSAFALGSGPVTYAWDLDGDGQFDDATGDTVSLPDSDGPANFPASVRMTDSLSTLERSEAIPINNAAPFVDAPFTESVIAGAPLVMNVTANDIAADQATGMTWRIDWGDGNVETTSSGHPSATMFSHFFTQPGQASITFEATDKDGGTGSTFRDVWVLSAVIGVFDGPDTSGGELRDGQSRLSFSTSLGATQDRALTILNRSASPATLGPLSLPNGYTLVAPPSFPATLAPGATLTLTLRFIPLTDGSFDGNLALTTSDSALPVFDLALSGFADAPDIAVSEFNSERRDFASDTESFSLVPGTQPFNGLSIHIESSNSNAPLVIQSIDLPTGFQFVIPPDKAFPLDLSNDGSIDIRFQCNATDPGFYKGWVRILSNDPNESPFRFFVTSRVGNVADLRVSSATNDLDSALGLILNGQNTPIDFPLQLRLANQGDTSLTVSAVTLPTGFAFATPPTLPQTLAQFGSTTLPEIHFTATAPGTYSGEVVLTNTDPDENPFHFGISATIPVDGPTEPAITTFTLTPATPTSGASISANISGPPNATVVLEGSSDLGQLDDWSEITRTTLDGLGLGTLSATPAPGTSGIARFFVRLRLAP